MGSIKQPKDNKGRFNFNEINMRVSDYQEDEIVEGCLSGGRMYQKLLYERYYGSMMVVCLRYTNDREEARDVLHEGFMKVLKT